MSIVSAIEDSVEVRVNVSIEIDVQQVEKTENIRFLTYKNLLVISLTFLLQYIAYDSIKNLQSSINTDGNIGVNSLSIIHGCFLFSSLFLTHPIISVFGFKWTLFLSQIPYV
ncbi:hypothetical protein I4U23_005009 [Adineta vaga]|nr:hypothetical protein I4U23_005009 [Adineta vaga]